MPRTAFSVGLLYPDHQVWHSAWVRLVLPFTLWICVSLVIRYGYFGDCQLVLGPNSSRLLETSPLFVEQIQASSGASRRELRLHGFSEKPELSLETNWSLSDSLFVRPYRRQEVGKNLVKVLERNFTNFQGLSLWLNRGSRFQVTWQVDPSSSKDLLVTVIKGEYNFETLQPHCTSAETLGIRDVRKAKKGAEYIIAKDDSYYIGFVNLNPQSVSIAMRINLTSKLHDTTKASTNCSTSNGLCSLKLLFPNTQYVVLSTSNNDGGNFWYIELSFAGRLVTYVIILGLIVVIVAICMKYLGACNNGRIAADIESEPETVAVAETDPLMPTKEVPCLYGATEEDSESSLCDGSSNDLYDGKICVICYEEDRNCFFIPCGHCATCCACAQRIVEGENKVCPICRRLIHKVRRLLLS